VRSPQLITAENLFNFFPAGVQLSTLAGSDTGVFTGSFADDHKMSSLKDPERLSRYAGIGTSFSILANRLSWWFNLRGPSMNIDTACSSALVAMHLASQSLRTGESTMASN
jgi:acyl transferase domain-containing protein